eukprot:217824_1
MSVPNLPAIQYMIAGFISLCITLFALLLLLYELYCNRNNPSIPCWFKLPSVISCTSYVLSCFAYLACCYYIVELDSLSSLNNYNDTHQLMCIISITCLITLVLCAKLFIYITFLSRLYLTFIDSIHRISYSLLRFMIFLLILFTLIIIWFNTLLYLKYVFYEAPFKSFQIQLIIVFCSILFCDVTISIITVYLFLRKLFLLITARRRSIIARSNMVSVSKTPTNSPSYNPTVTTVKQLSFSHSVNAHSVTSKQKQIVLTQTPEVRPNQMSLTPIDDDKESDPNGSIFGSKRNSNASNVNTMQQLPSVLVRLSPSDLVIIDAMTKYTILNILIIIVSQLAFMAFLFVGLIHILYEYWNILPVKHEKFLTRTLTNIVLMITFPLDSSVNCMVLLLNFKFSEPIYLKLCTCIHNYIQLKYAYKVEKNLKGFARMPPDDFSNRRHKTTEMTTSRKHTESSIKIVYEE